MAQLLLVHHTTSPATEELLEAVLAGTRDEAIIGVEVIVRPALSASPSDVLTAGGYLLGTPANIGYISGALKHFFDTVYYPCRQATRGRPFGAYVHGNQDSAGAERAIATITTGLGWQQVAPILTARGAITKETKDACYELGGTLAAQLMDAT